MLLFKYGNNIENLFYMCIFCVSVDKRRCQEAAVSGLASGLVNWPFIWRLKCLLTFAALLHWSTLGDE